ncbi:protein Tube [Neodiprion fabricii]|uniref:protein Tube n=1 Tax=Neodiprion fabricii TaxID=2872261 RepID=UPI001ED97CB5|nr:protein Tube [Neodiprion fabricii]
MDANTEIRKLRPAELYKLGRILTASDSWKMLMAIVPKEGTENVPKFSTEHFELIEQASRQQRKSAAEIFLEEWSTMGKRRPTLQSTLTLLVKAQLFKAADYIAVDLLHGQPPQRPLSGPAAPVIISDEEIEMLLNETASEHDEKLTCRISEPPENLDVILDGMSYPSELSYQNSTESKVLVNETLKNSDLMQFSISSTKLCKSSHQNLNVGPESNLIQFSSNSVHDSTNSSLSILKQVQKRSSVKHGHKDFRAPNNGVESSYDGANEFTTVSDYDQLELKSSELPAVVANLGNGIRTTYSELDSSELPQIVAEIGKRESSNPTKLPAKLQSFGENTDVSTSSTSSDSSSSNSDTNAMNTYDNYSNDNIPICVNALLGSSENYELVTAELPQIVADLGRDQQCSFTDSKSG